MGVIVRNMQVEDLVDVKRADLMSWSDMMAKQYGQKQNLHPRTDENIISYINSDPGGAFVAVDEFAGIVGMSFSHVWGATGWVGPLSVLPSYQARGLGKDLLKRSLAYLEDQGCLDIGLETMPENQTNLALYLKVGLRTEGMILIFKKQLDDEELQEEPAGTVAVQRFSESEDKDRIESELRRISGDLRMGLDYTKEAHIAQELDLGDTMVATVKDRVVGFAIVHTKARRENLKEAGVRVLCVDPAAEEDVVEPLLISSELMAADAGCTEVTAPASALCRRGVSVLFSRGYLVTKSLERLMWMGSSGTDDKNYNMSSWSG